MRIVLLGKSGQVGAALLPLLLPLGDVFSLGHGDMDLADEAELRGLLRKLMPDIVINTAAYTNVDQAEQEKIIVGKVNADAPGFMMEELNAWGGALIHFSTDYVFDGTKQDLYVEDDVPNPINEYGRTKLEGECRIEQIGGRYLIFRTSWVYAEKSTNFVTNVMRWASTRDAIKIVDDQIGSPTWSGMLAEQIAGLVQRRQWREFMDEHAGIYHCAGKGAISRFEFAREILHLSPIPTGKQSALIPAKTRDFPSPALRPGYSALDCSKFEKVFDVLLPEWRQSLLAFMQRLTP
jgi:dTDP-4-dehydrorhamnose reductase